MPISHKSPNPAPLPSRLEDHLGYWLRFVSNHVSASFARRLEARNVTVSEWVALRQLYDAGRCSPSELSTRMGMNKGAVSRLIERLLKKDLVSRIADEHDGRAQIVFITSRGQKLVPELAAIADENDRAFFAHLSHGTRALLFRTLRRLVQENKFEQVPTE